jgi:hypothetical protein
LPHCRGSAAAPPVAGAAIITIVTQSDIPALLERYRRGPELLAVVLTGVFGEEEDFGLPGKWSIRQLVAHLADTELVAAHRFRQVIAEDNPTLVPFNQAAWATRLDYARRKPKQSLETFRRLRSENHDLLKGVAPEDFLREGTHTERGRLSLGSMLEGYAAHAESHARQLQEIREAYKRTKPPGSKVH